jgi:Spy/CpxP family protein refolding chaperone
MNTARLKIVLSLSALFFFGGVCGFGFTRGLPAPVSELRPWSEDAWLKQRMQEDIARLNLTAEQAQKLKGHYDELQLGIRAVHAETSQRVGALFVQHFKSVVQDFTPEQREAYKKLCYERHAARLSAN